jgi:hypothetical protein
MLSIMMKVLVLALALPLVGCVVGSAGTAPGGGDDMTGSDGSGSGSGTMMTGLSGHITTNTTWTGTEAISGAVTIDPGVTVTVMAGTTINVAASASITVSGTLDIEGKSGSGVTIGPASGTGFGGIDIPSGGVLTMKYTTVTGAEVATSTSGTTTISDSHLSNSPGDLIIMGGGTVTLMYSQLGVEAPASDTTHCNMHFNAGSDVIKVSHTNVTNTPATNPSAPTFGIMFYGGQAADFTYDNWVLNSTNVDPQPGVSGDFSNSYFTGTVPSGVGLTVNTPAAARLAVCNGANDATCAGVHP